MPLILQNRLRNPIHTERPMRVICIGAGASGLLFAYKLQRSFNNFSLTIYEKNPEVSGTWYENKYPGCACDVPSHNYTWSFEPKHNWSGVYATSGEIYQYFNDFATKYQLRKYVKTKHQVSHAHWNEDVNEWRLEIMDLQSGQTIQDSCDILINACGFLNSWKWPAVPGLKNFKGKLLHTAKWDDSVDLAGKNVGLIGNGSSGIQVTPAIQPIVSKLTAFIRNPTWISPPFGVPGVEAHTYSDSELAEFRDNPEALTTLRKGNEAGLNSMFDVYLKNTKLQRESRAAFAATMRSKLQDGFLEEKLIPKFGPGCRRMTPGVNYLESLKRDNVKVVFGSVEKITERGCVCDDGEEYAVDVLICATGFNTSFRPRFPIIGLGNHNLQDAWAKEAKSYLGLAAAGMPNYFMFMGPNCPVGNGPLLIAIEAQADYILKFCDRWQTENIASMTPKMEAVDDFVEHTNQFMNGAIWTEECRSWYKCDSESGRVSALWPGSTLHYMEMLGEIRYEDWRVGHEGNRFAFMGNGYSQVELDPTCDLAYYIRTEDDSEYTSKAKRREALTNSGSVKQ